MVTDSGLFAKIVSTSCASIWLVSLIASGLSGILFVSKPHRVFSNMVVRAVFIVFKLDSLPALDALFSQVKVFGSRDKAVLQT